MFQGTEKYSLRAGHTFSCNFSNEEKLYHSSPHSIADFFRYVGLIRNRFNANMNDSLQASIVGKLISIYLIFTDLILLNNYLILLNNYLIFT